MNRHYSSAQGRFTQVDPIGMRAASLGNPQSLNLYSYCGNDPINHVDPDGLFWGWAKKLFKFATFGIWGFKAVRQAAIKVLSNKWVQLAIAVALAILSPPAGAIIWNFSAAAQATANGVSGLLAGLQAVGAVSSFAAQKRKRKSEGRAVLLSGNLLATFNAARDAARKILDNPDSDCAKFLRNHGIDPKRVSDGLKNRTPYDGMASTNTDSFGVIEDKVSNVFKTYGPDAANNNSHTRIYYAPSGLTTTILIHEEIHPIEPPNTSDKAIYEQLGGTADEYDKSGMGSKIVSKKLEENGCK